MANSRLIVHADDFGLSVPVNEGIIRAYKNGILTSTSIMANTESFDDAIKKCKTFPGLDIGIHLTLIEEKPLCDPATVPSLVTENNCFYEHATVFFKRYLTGKISLAEIEKELEAQIKKVLKTEVEISHLDSHQHLHILPGIMKLLVKLANKHNIPAIRFPREKLNKYMFKDPKYFSRLIQMLIVNTLSLLSRSSETVSPNEFYGFYFGGRINKQNLSIILENNDFIGTAELMCHPGETDPTKRYSHWNYNWEDELDSLIDKDIKHMIEEKGIQLISYRDLKPI